MGLVCKNQKTVDITPKMDLEATKHLGLYVLYDYVLQWSTVKSEQHLK